MNHKLAQCYICKRELECDGVPLSAHSCKDFDRCFLSIEMEKTLEELSLTKRLYKMKTKEQIAVMQAFLEGKTIETKSTMGWYVNPDPRWNWENCDYRIKEAPKYRPYNSAEEFLQASKEHGIWLCHKDSKDYLLLHEVDSRTLKARIYKFEYTFEELLKYYTWQDETPCGILE